MNWLITYLMKHWVALVIYFVVVYALIYLANLPDLIAIILAWIAGFWVERRYNARAPKLSNQSAVVLKAVEEARQMVREGYPEKNALVYVRYQMIEGGFSSSETDKFLTEVGKSAWVKYGVKIKETSRYRP
jgi:hypothetical protein